MITLNGRSANGRDNFIVISTVGKSVVDYAIVGYCGIYTNYSRDALRQVLYPQHG